MKTPSSIHIKRSGSVVVNFNEEVNDDGFANSSIQPLDIVRVRDNPGLKNLIS